MKTSGFSPFSTDKEAFFDQNFSKIRQSLQYLQYDIAQLEEKKVQSLKCLQKYSHDIAYLKTLLDEFRAKVQYSIQPPLASSGEKSSASLAHFQKLESDKISWNFYDNFDKSKVLLRYAISINALVCSVCFSPDGSQFSFTDQKFLYLINSSDGSLFKSWDIQSIQRTPEHHNFTISFSPSSQYLALGAPDYSILIFDLKTYQLSVVLKKHIQEISSICFFHDNVRFVSSGFDGKIIFWDLEKQNFIKIINHESITSISRIALSYDDSFLVAGFYDGSIVIYNLLDFDRKSFKAHNQPLVYVNISHNNSLIASSSRDFTVKIWNKSKIDSGNIPIPITLEGHSDCVLTSCFSPDDELVFSGSRDESIKCWSVKTGKNIWTIQTKSNSMLDIDHSICSKTLITCNGQGLICIWDYE